MTRARDPIYACHRYPAEIISYAVCRIRDHDTAANFRAARKSAFAAWAEVTGVAMAA
jgi:hypothetical protein